MNQAGVRTKRTGWGGHGNMELACLCKCTLMEPLQTKQKWGKQIKIYYTSQKRKAGVMAYALGCHFESLVENLSSSGLINQLAFWKEKGLVYSICLLSLCKYSRHGQGQARHGLTTGKNSSIFIHELCWVHNILSDTVCPVFMKKIKNKK